MVSFPVSWRAVGRLVGIVLLISCAAGPAEAQPTAPPQTADLWQRSAGNTNLRLMDIALDVMVAAGGSTADGEELGALQAGAHDPSRTGFTLQQLELSAAGAVDPYFRADVFLIFQIDAEGESVFELEEAYLSTLALPGGLELRAGTFFPEFGRQNHRHPHSWQFVDQPVILSRLFGGDGLRGPGARLGWLMPTPWYSEWLWSVQNGIGETAVSFGGTDEEELPGGFDAIETESRWCDMQYTARWLNGVDLGQETAMNLGASMATGRNRSGTDNRTWVAGTDLYLKWQPATTAKGWPFVALQGEYLYRWYEGGANALLLRDHGGYGQITWGFVERWTIGQRVDVAKGKRGPSPSADPMRDERQRLSSALSWYPTEFSRLRLQYNFDRSEAIGDAHALWLQLEATIGAHAAHTF